jgi:predicted nucleic-acid-binding protein
MKALDTNVLIRFLVRDDEEMARKTCDLLEHVQIRKERLLIPTPVLLETFWVLQSYYSFTRTDILDVVEKLAGLPALEFEQASLPWKFLEVGRATRLDLADILIGVSARARGCEVTLTFDKKAGRSDLFEILGQ